MVPDPDTCYSLMEKYGMYPHIRDHSLMVGQVADLLIKGLNRAGLTLNQDLALAGALLHDIAKSECIESGCGHDLRGAEICRELGYNRVAEIVEEHVILRKGNEQPLNEKLIVYYADKRVNHDRIVSLKERLASILRRYAKDDPEMEQSIEDNFRVCFEVEREIFKHLDFSPDQIEDRLGNSSLKALLYGRGVGVRN